MQFISGLLHHYGYVVLFLSITVELIALPTPGETLMTYCGYLVYLGKLNMFLSIVFASLGAITGITISFFIGTTWGYAFFEKYGKYIKFKKESLDKTSLWFEKYGSKLLIVSYYIPGVRHVTGYIAGITKISYKKFALHAYSGAIIWTSTFIILGHTLGARWNTFHIDARNYVLIGAIIIGLGLLLFYLYKYFKHQIYIFVVRQLSKTLKTLKSLVKVEASIAALLVAFISFLIFLIGLARIYLRTELHQFDIVVAYVIRNFVNENNLYFVKFFIVFTSFEVLILMFALLLLYIMGKGFNRILELRFLFLIIPGGEFLEETLRLLFHRLGPTGPLFKFVRYTFPSGNALMGVVVYGFFAYMLIRHGKKRWITSTSIFISVTLCILVGISSIYLRQEYPGDVFAGYILGTLWLSCNIILMEIFRVLPKIRRRRLSRGN